MADIGPIASIIGVAGAGFRLSFILNAVSCEVPEYGLGLVHSISKSVTLFSMILKQTGTALQAADSVHSNEAVQTAKSIAEESTRVFDEINDMLDRLRTKQISGDISPTIQQRFRWCFRHHRVTYLLAQLESLKLSLFLMLQVIELGKIMASTSRSDPPEEVALKTEAIRQERAEAQNAVIVRYWQMNNMDRLFEASRKEEEEDRTSNASASTSTPQDHEFSLVESDSLQWTADAPPPEYAPMSALVRLPVYSLGELDHTLHQIKGSPRDMIRVSDQAIDPLLERWTKWREVRERRHNRDSGVRFVPSVQNLDEADEDDEDRPFHERYEDQEENTRGYYLEGKTTDWRRPNSAAARQEALRRRKQYSNFQPTVSTAESDVENSPNGNASNKRTAKRHLFEMGSESESSVSEPELLQPKPRRRSSGSPPTERKISAHEGISASHSYTAPVQPPAWITANSVSRSNRAPSVTSGQSTASRLSSPAYHPPGHRPWATPDQTSIHHSLSLPLPPVHTANAPNPYTPQQHAGFPRYAGQPTAQFSPYSAQPGAQSRYIPPSPNPTVSAARPGSQDGKHGRSPSRLSQHSTPARSYIRSEDDKRHSREKSTKQNLREGATKGLLGAGAIAGFLQALEGLSI
ncbi:hypothetical protein A1O3_10482 [Capronia epimyces CBS 606.96]|uniref:Fungal N-terminal domain-containing protein n=1 Tax=Capronia epimyces CBS 606.96 TaxID=1182542 RepID=W9X8S3_9EURO|nr:uncharacterized protein A1O3_10482 [Capronia epimyces CBS 606.96]EXJ76837.1 hypothetical protein A1O3_10482 [Capronia epimyces CBS 606.96]